MPAPRPTQKAPPGLLDNAPSKWERTKEVLWDSNLAAPIREVYGLLNTPYEVLMGGPSPEFDQAVADSFDAAGGAMVGGSVVPKPSNALAMGIKAYHGSPHSFDKFSIDKIGTGEGAQAYGHGLYFTDVEGTARGYRDTLKPGSGTRPEDTASRVLDAHNGDRDAALETLRESIDRAFANNAPYEDVQRLMQAKNIINTQPERATGSMYEVDIDADPTSFINYDLPLSEQSPEVQAALKKHYGFTYDSKEQQGWIGGDVVNTSAKSREHAKELNQLGINGVKYLDGVSRKGGSETPQYNYVVFDDNLINIIRKYGLAGLLGSSAAMQAAQGDPNEVY